MPYVEAPRPDVSLIGKITKKIKEYLPNRVNSEQELQMLAFQVIRKTFQDIKDNGWVDIDPYSVDCECFHLNLKAAQKKFEVFMHVESEGDHPNYITLGISDDLPDGENRRDFLFGGDIDHLATLGKFGEHDLTFLYTKVEPETHDLTFGERLSMNERIRFLQELMLAEVDLEATQMGYEKRKSDKMEFVLWARERFSPRLS